jgi:hypothetical protein
MGNNKGHTHLLEEAPNPVCSFGDPNISTFPGWIPFGSGDC